MAAFYSITSTISGEDCWYTVTTSTTTGTADVIIYANDYAATNYGVVYSAEDDPKRQPAYAALLPLVVHRDIRRAQLANGRSVLAAMPRGKLDRWKSLKEKRRAWGIS